MKEILNILTGEVSRIAGKEVDPAIVRNSLFFVTASIMGLKRMHYKKSGVTKYANFFGITLAPSGEGKDLSLMVCERMFEDALEKYSYISKKSYEMLNGPLPDGSGGNDDQDFIVPSQYKVSLQGTSQGMMRVANFYNRSDTGSLNVVSTEFGHELNSEVLPILTKLWQEAKADGSTNVNEKYPPVSEVPTNIILFGSNAPFERSGNKHDALVDAIESGLARRTFFVWSDSDEIRTTDSNARDFGADISDYGRSIVEAIKTRDREIAFSAGADEALFQYRENLVSDFNETPSSWNRIRTSNVDKVERLSAIIAILDMSGSVERRHVEMAIDIARESDQAMESVIRPIMPYVQMYRLLNLEPAGLTITEMIEMGVRLKTKREIEDSIELLEEYAYRKNMKMKRIGKHKLVLEALPKTNLDKMIVSVNMEPNRPTGTKFAGHEVPFFGKKMTIRELVTSKLVPSFCLVHFEDEKRNAKNAIPGQNMIAFDIDDGTSLEEAMQIFKPFTHIIYTTRSHQKEKGGEVCDRFRVILPTKNIFYVNAEQHKQLIANIANVLGIPSYDVSTRNQDRLWFTNTEAIVYENEAELIELDCCIPNTESQEEAERVLDDIDSTKVSDDRRVAGMQKWTITNAMKGSRNNLLLRLHRFVRDLTGSKEEADRIVYQTNAMLHEPLPELELQKTVCR